MKRLLVYVHFNKYDDLSAHVLYQLEQLRPLFSRVIVLSNSRLSKAKQDLLRDRHLMDDFIQRDNAGYDFAAWADGLAQLSTEELAIMDSVTLMNDTCFGPLWDLAPLYHRYEVDEAVDFWGMTNHRATKAFPEHIQSYFMVFKKVVVRSAAFQGFWDSVVSHRDVQAVIDHYETQLTSQLLEAGFAYETVLDTVKLPTEGMLHPDFTYYNPTAILQGRVPFIKVKAIDANQHISPYLLAKIDEETTYPVDLLVQHMSMINLPDFPYLLGRKYLSADESLAVTDKKVAVHLHAFYTDLLPEFFQAFATYPFAYDLYITTDKAEKELNIQEVLEAYGLKASIHVTGNIGRDVLPMLKLKEQLSAYDYVGHFHTKKSKEADFWAGESWRRELLSMLVKPASTILSQMDQRPEVGLVIADIPSFFRYNKIVDAWNEQQMAPLMNQLWQEMGLAKPIDFNAYHTFVMSYGTFVWFRYEALKPLFDLDLTDQDVPAEPLPQNSILHAIERLLVYIAWNQQYDFRIARNAVTISPFVDNKQLNLRGQSAPNTFVDFTYMGGIKGAFKYIIIGPARAVKYIIKRLIGKLRDD